VTKLGRPLRQKGEAHRGASHSLWDAAPPEEGINSSLNRGLRPNGNHALTEPSAIQDCGETGSRGTNPVEVCARKKEEILKGGGGGTWRNSRGKKKEAGVKEGGAFSIQIESEEWGEKGG